MALPGNTLIDPPSPAPFDIPDDINGVLPTEDYERGGIALNNASQGLQVQNWRFSLAGNDVVVAPEPYIAPTILFNRPGITWLSGTFNQNMAPSVVFLVGTQATLWWFDTTAGQQVFTDLVPGVVTPMLSMDDKRKTANSYNDMLLSYIIGNTLAYRQQRDRFATERILRTFSGSDVQIVRFGMSRGLRMQWELTGVNAA